MLQFSNINKIQRKLRNETAFVAIYNISEQILSDINGHSILLSNQIITLLQLMLENVTNKILLIFLQTHYTNFRSKTVWLLKLTMCLISIILPNISDEAFVFHQGKGKLQRMLSYGCVSLDKPGLAYGELESLPVVKRRIRCILREFWRLASWRRCGRRCLIER